MNGDRGAGASWSERYRDPRVVERYIADRFASPLGALLHARQTAVVRRTLLAHGGGRVLEVAAGPARFLPELARHGARPVFMDWSLPMLLAARYIPVDQLGTCDDTGFAPYADDRSTSRETALAKIRARIQGTALAAAQLGA